MPREIAQTRVVVHHTSMLTVPRQIARGVRRRVSLALGLGPRRDLRAMLGFISRARALVAGTPVTGGTTAVLLTPWVHAPVPFYSVALGLALRARGQDVVFLACPDPTGTCGSMQLVDTLVAALRPFVRCNVVPVVPSTNTPPTAGLPAVAQAQLIWESRAAAFPALDSPAVRERTRILCPTVEALRNALAKTGAQGVLLPGGFVGAAGAALAAAESLGLRVATFDSGPDEVLFSANGVAAQHGDFPASLKLLLEATQEERAACVAWARAEHVRRTNGAGAFQPVAASAPSHAAHDGNPPGQTVLIPLNVEWDAAALRRHRVFDTAKDWLGQTVGFLLEHTTASVVVRQHPHERLPGLGSKADYLGILAPFLGHPRLRFVAAQEPVNTYDLMARSHLVLPKASTAGIEAAALGHHVVVEAASYYSSLPYVQLANSRQEYLERISGCLAAPQPGPNPQQDLAWLSLYLTQKCGFAYTRFNPHQASFQNWVGWELATISALPEVQDMCASVMTGAPFLWLVHLRHRDGIMAG